MKKLNKLLTLTVAMALLANTAFSQDPNVTYNQECNDDAIAYDDCGYASNMSALLPVGALIIAGVLIATTSRHHHHSSYSRSSTTSSTTHAHAHSSSSS